MVHFILLHFGKLRLYDHRPLKISVTIVSIYLQFDIYYNYNFYRRFVLGKPTRLLKSPIIKIITKSVIRIQFVFITQSHATHRCFTFIKLTTFVGNYCIWIEQIFEQIIIVFGLLLLFLSLLVRVLSKLITEYEL